MTRVLLTFDTHVLDAGAYRLGARPAVDQPAALPPFGDLPIDPAALWA